MNLRRWIPQARVVTFGLSGLTAGVFVASGMAAVAGVALPNALRLTGSVAAFAAVLAIACLLLVDRRKRDRPA